jgi:hypothetical protein
MKRLVLETYAGLCNRLRVLISARYLAEKYGRQLVLCWRPDDDCGTHFRDLFTNPIPETQALPTPPLPTADCTPENIVRALQSSDPIVSIRECHWLVANADKPTTIPYFHALHPVEAVTHAVTALAQQFRSRTVGVHVRRGDFAEHLSRHRNIGLTPLEHYFHFLNGWDSIFLATDGGNDVIAPFRQRFGPRLITQPHPCHARHTPQAIQNALVDLYLLQRCQAIVGTRFSSFSELGWVITGVPRVKVSVREPTLLPRLKFSSRIMLRRFCVA